MTIGDNQTISASDLNTEHNANRTTIDLIRQAKVGLRVQLSVQSIGTGTAEVARQVIFTPQDNYELVALWADVDIDGGGTGDLTATLSVSSGETEYLLDDTPSASVTISGSPSAGTTNYAGTSSTRYVLRKGVAYALTLAADDTFDNVSAVAVFKVKRRYS